MKFGFIKKVLVLSALLFCFAGVLFSFAQEYEEDDDFDSLFDDAATDVVVEQSVPVLNPVTTTAATAASLIKFTGSMSSNIGAAVIIDQKIHPTGYFDFSNTLNMKIRPSESLAINGAVKVSTDNNFSIGLSYFYIDYLALNKFYISAGKKDESLGGYTRLFSEAALSDTSGFVNIDVRYPWSTGTLKLVGSYNPAATGKEPSASAVTYGASLEQTIGHTSVNLFGKKYGSAQTGSNGVHLHPVAGLEAKRTVFGYDAYVQTVAQLADYKKITEKAGYEKVSATAGFYRLWDAKEPHFGINIEYKYIWTPAVEKPYSNLVALQAGIKRLGKSKNLKFGLDWNHNINEVSGNVKAAFLTGGIFPYANWSNGIEFDYKKDQRINPKLASVISISLDY